MAMKRCPDCGEKYSDTYKYCPFCEEEEVLRKGKDRGGRRARQSRHFSVLTPILVVLILILLVLTTLLVNKIIHSRMGDAILAIRDDDLAAGAMGINVFKYKTLAIVIASMLAGVAGAFYAVYTSYIDPSCFTNAVSNNMLVMVIFGGLGNMFGSFLGATVLTILPEALRGFSEYRQMVFGAMLVILMLVRPEGLFGSVNFKYIGQRLSLKKSKRGGGSHV